MSNILSFVSPLEFLLRYTVIIGIVIAVVGVSILFMAKRITLAKRNTDILDKSDKLYQALLIVGIALILVAMIIIALPIENTFYKA